MPTTRRSFLKQSASAASVCILLPKISAARDAAPECTPPSSSALRPDPNICVLFSGLLLYQFGSGKTAVCDVNPLKDVSGHFYSVVVMVREGASRPYIRWRFFGKPKNQLTLNVAGAKEGVQKYAGLYSPTDPFDRSSDTNDCKDWRWTLRVEEFLEKGEQKPEFHLWKGLQLTSGLFYTEIKTSKARIGVRREPMSSGSRKELYSVGSVAGANIYFDGGTGASLDLGGLGLPVEMPNLPDVRYEIYVDYSPDRPDLLRASTRGTRSHFHRYNEKIKRRKPRILYDVIYYENPLAAKGTKFGTPDVPCMGLEG